MFGRSKKHLTYQQGHVDGSTSAVLMARLWDALHLPRR
jgi:hypothetical protein